MPLAPAEEKNGLVLGIMPRRGKRASGDEDDFALYKRVGELARWAHIIGGFSGILYLDAEQISDIHSDDTV